MKTFLTVLMLSVLFSVRGYAEDQGGAQAQVKGVTIKKGLEHVAPAVPKIKLSIPQTLPKVPRQIPAPPKVTQPYVGTAKLPPGLAKREALPAGFAKKVKLPAGWEKGQKKGWVEQDVTEENLKIAKSKLVSDAAVAGESSPEERSGKPKKDKVKKVKGEKKK